MRRILDIFVSFWQLTSRVIFARKRQVLFYYPQHFNRTAEGTNPFFDRLLETCDRHGISYHLIEEPDWGTDKPRNPRAIKGDALFILILVLRKIVGLFSNKDFWEKEKMVAPILNFLTLGRLQRRTYITISGSMLHLFGDLNSDGIVYDMQHGVLYKQHPTFFDEQQHLRPQFYKKNLHWLFWGKGYEHCFSRGDEEILEGRCHITGYPLFLPPKTAENEDAENVVLFSLQFTHEKGSMPIFEIQKIMFDNVLDQLKGLNVRVLLKHHPRFNNDISIDDWLEKYDFVGLTTLSMHQLVPQVMLQVTFNSTTAFEYAEYGIPSFFIDPTSSLPTGNLFYDEYAYPLYAGMTIAEVVQRLQDPVLRAEDQQTVSLWYRQFYTDFDEQAFLNCTHTKI